MTELEKIVKASQVAEALDYGESIPEERLEKFAHLMIEWVAKMHYDQCREERPVQDWIRSIKPLLNMEMKK